jgi:23S rRNA (pseudouridine1915-N3)-methyltransferase
MGPRAASFMKLQLWSFGKTHESYIREGMELFQERINHYCDFEFKLFSAGKNTASLSPEELKKKEARILLAALEPRQHLIALDERGKALSTLQFADLLDKQRISGSTTLVFLIGGAYGLDESVLLKARQILSISRFTFPHQLVRLIMAEQIYRAFTVLNHEKYHHQ